MLILRPVLHVTYATVEVHDKLVTKTIQLFETFMVCLLLFPVFASRCDKANCT